MAGFSSYDPWRDQMLDTLRKAGKPDEDQQMVNRLYDEAYGPAVKRMSKAYNKRYWRDAYERGLTPEERNTLRPPQEPELLEKLGNMFAPALTDQITTGGLNEPDKSQVLGDIVSFLDFPEAGPAKVASTGLKELLPYLGVTMFKKRPEAFKQLIKNMERVAPSEAKSFARKYSKDIPRSVPKVSSELIEDYGKAMAPEWGKFGIENEVRSSVEGHLFGPRFHRMLPPGLKPKEEPALSLWDPDIARYLAKQARERGQTWQPQWRNPVEIVHESPMRGQEDLIEFIKNQAKELDKLSRGGKYGGGLHISQSFPELHSAPESIVPPLAWEYAMFEPTIFPPRAVYKPGGREHVTPFMNWLKTSSKYEKVLTPDLAGKDYRDAIPGMKFQSAFNLSHLPAAEEFRRIEYRPFSSSEKLNPEVAENFVLLQNMLDMARRDPQKWPEYQEALPKLYREAIEPRMAQILSQQRGYVPEGISEIWSPYANGLLEPEFYRPLEDIRVRRQAGRTTEEQPYTFRRPPAREATPTSSRAITEEPSWLPQEGSELDYAVNWYLRNHPRSGVDERTLRSYLERQLDVDLSHPGAISREQADEIANLSARARFDEAMGAIERGGDVVRRAIADDPMIEDLLQAATEPSAGVSNRRGALGYLFPDEETANVMTYLKSQGRIGPYAPGSPELQSIEETGQQIWDRLSPDDRLRIITTLRDYSNDTTRDVLNYIYNHQGLETRLTGQERGMLTDLIEHRGIPVTSRD
jgi:hypothetical protein